MEDPAAYDSQRRRLVIRDAAAEQDALQRLQQLGFRRGWARRGAQVSSPSPSTSSRARFGRSSTKAGTSRRRGGSSARPGSFNMQVKSGIDWFELHGTVDFGEGRSASIAELLAALRRGDATVVLDDGTRGMVPEEWLRRYVAHRRLRRRPKAITSASGRRRRRCSTRCSRRSRRSRSTKRSRAPAPELQKFSGIRRSIRRRRSPGTLRDYQREGLGWFDFLRRFGFGGCLADDMGLGKTVMVLALLEAQRTSRRSRGGSRPRPSLVVVPRSLVFNWMDEAARFAPELRVLDYTGTSRDAAAIADYDLVLTTYGTLRRDAARLRAH